MSGPLQAAGGSNTSGVMPAQAPRGHGTNRAAGGSFLALLARIVPGLVPSERPAGESPAVEVSEESQTSAAGQTELQAAGGLPVSPMQTGQSGTPTGQAGPTQGAAGEPPVALDETLGALFAGGDGLGAGVDASGVSGVPGHLQSAAHLQSAGQSPAGAEGSLASAAGVRGGELASPASAMVSARAVPPPAIGALLPESSGAVGMSGMPRRGEGPEGSTATAAGGSLLGMAGPAETTGARSNAQGLSGAPDSTGLSDSAGRSGLSGPSDASGQSGPSLILNRSSPYGLANPSGPANPTSSLSPSGPPTSSAAMAEVTLSANPTDAMPVYAAGAGISAGGVDPTRIEKSLGLLHPEFRVRLERVVVRMEQEYGHDVSIVETYRHQARQNHLYEQGRSTKGDVVTWTRNSNHTQGTAADIIIDGSYANPRAYARLGEIAAQEGLRTLGARDPGHIELTGAVVGGQLADGTDAATARAGATIAGSRGPSGGGEGNRVLRPDELAQPARVADLARVEPIAVARVATVAVPSGSHRSPTPRGSAATAEPAPSPSIPPAPPLAPAPEMAPQPIGAFASIESHQGDGAAQRSTPITSGSAERIAHLLDLDSSSPLKPLHQLLLRLDGSDGEDRIRLDLRGNMVGATIDTGDSVTAERLGTRLGDLQRALEKHGLEAESLQIRTVQRAETVVSSRTPLTTLETEAARVASQRGQGDLGQRERPNQEPGDDRNDFTNPRNRSRKEHSGGQNA